MKWRMATILLTRIALPRCRRRGELRFWPWLLYWRQQGSGFPDVYSSVVCDGSSVVNDNMFSYYGVEIVYAKSTLT